MRRALLLVLFAVMAAPVLAADLAPEGLGLTLHAPEGWRVTEPEPYTVLLLPPAGEAAGLVSVSVQNRPRPDDAAPGRGPELLADRYVSELRAQAAGVTVQRRAPFRWDGGDTVLMGRQVVADFTTEGLPLRQWAVFLPSPLGPAVHVWLYTAPAARFDQWLPPARAILESLVPVPQPPSDKKR